MPIASQEILMTRTALYARVSTLDRGQDPETQLAELRAVAAQRGWTVTGEYVDRGVSGGRATRPELDRLMADARRCKLDVVAVWKFDRFARSTTHLLAALEEFGRLGVDFVSLREQIDTATPVGKMVFTMVGAMAEFEKSLIVERVKAGVARAQAEGKHCGRPRKALDLRAARLLLEAGKSEREVADMLGLPRATLQRRLREAGPKAPDSEAA